MVEPGLLEVNDRDDLGSGAQDVAGAEIMVNELRRQPVGWRVSDQPAQGIPSRRGYMLGAGFEPVGGVAPSAVAAATGVARAAGLQRLSLSTERIRLGFVLLLVLLCHDVR